MEMRSLGKENQEFGQGQTLPAPGQKAVITQSLLAAVLLAEHVAISCISSFVRFSVSFFSFLYGRSLELVLPKWTNLVKAHLLC